MYLIDKYFLNEYCPFSQRRSVNKKSVAAFISFLIILFIVLVLFTTETPESPKKKGAAPAATAVPVSASPVSSSYFENPYRALPKSGYSAQTSRSFAAPQIVKRDGRGASERLPLGTVIPAKLLNTVISSDQNSPVIALINDDIYFENSSVIPAESKVVGTATLDNTSKRLQARFHTIVFPDGSQASISALALLEDGSSGLTGSYHSNNTTNQIGRFSGTFLGGMAQGLKQRESGGFSGPFEQGSLKNGLLNAVSESARDQANHFSDGMKNAVPYLEVQKGAHFFLYLEKEFTR